MFAMTNVVYLTHLYNDAPAVIPVKLVPEGSNRGTGIQKQKEWIPGQARNDNK